MKKNNILSILSDVLYQINDSIIIYKDDNKNIIYANKSALSLFRYTNEEISKKKIKELFNDDLIFHEDYYIDKMPQIKFNQACINKNNEIFYNDINILSVIKDDIKYVIQIFKSKNIEFANEIKTAMLELSLNAICIINNENKIVYLNQTAYEILGYEKNEIINKNFEKFIIRNRSYKNLLNNIIKHAHASGEIKIINKSGIISDIIISIYVYNKTGLNETIASFIDISKNKIVERELLIFKKYAEASSQGFRISTLDGYIIYANPILSKLLNISDLDSLYGNSIFDYIFDDSDEKIKKEIISELKKQGQWKGELKLKITKDEYIPIIDNFFIIHNNDKKPEYIADVITDISEIKNLQDQLIQSEKLSAIGQLAAGVAHEFNNILAVIKSTSQMLLFNNNDGSVKLPDDIITEIENIDKQTVRGAKIVSNLMTLVRPKKLNEELCIITEIIDEVISIQKKELDLENIKIIKNYADIPQIKVDKIFIHQIFLNLMINARHAIKPHGRGIINISVKNDNDIIEIIFKDNGIGMDDNIKSKIFNPFFSTKGAYAKDNLGIKGMGLGLSVVLKIIKDLKGAITVESYPDKGAEFIIKIPINVK